jgi:hypothetical protein
MTIKTKLIITAAFVALLSAPASARLVDDGGLSAYAQFGKEHVQMTHSTWQGHRMTRPSQHR